MKKSIIIISIVLVLAVAAYLLFRSPKEEKTDTGNKGTGGDPVKPPIKPAVPENVMPLRVGSGSVAGSEANTLVKDIQEALNTKFKAGLVTDGKFGPKTLAALLKNGFGGVIYWKQYAAITGKTIQVNGEDVKAWWDIF